MRKKGWFNPSHKNSAGFSDDVMNAGILYYSRCFTLSA